MRYAEIVAQLYRVRNVKLGLERCFALHDLLGRPSQRYPVIHVAGTNGKGSVATKIAAALQAGGCRVGLFTSPHLTSFRERIQVDRVPVSEEEVAAELGHLLELAGRHAIPSSFFELTTLFAFDHFARREVDVAVIEVGLGGRLDATNVVDPHLSVITSIGFDHCNILGHTLQEIAAEKGGIIKPGRPVVLGPKAQGLGLEEMAGERGAPLYMAVGGDSVDAENRSIALRALEVSGLSFSEEGLSARPPCRMERIGRATLDVAHNPDGIRRLVEGGVHRAVMGFSTGRNAREMVEPLVGKVAYLHLVTSSHPRIAPIEPLMEAAKELGLPLCEPHGDCRAVVSQLAGDFLLFGSCFLMGDALSALGCHPITDPQELSEIF